MDELGIAGRALVLVLMVARLAAQLKRPENRDAKRTLDMALGAVLASGAIQTILEST